jgi:hypothetical protein
VIDNKFIFDFQVLPMMLGNFIKYQNWMEAVKNRAQQNYEVKTEISWKKLADLCSICLQD